MVNHNNRRPMGPVQIRLKRKRNYDNYTRYRHSIQVRQVHHWTVAVHRVNYNNSRPVQVRLKWNRKLRVHLSLTWTGLGACCFS
jgi:hypothetical protein